METAINYIRFISLINKFLKYFVINNTFYKEQNLNIFTAADLLWILLNK
jgi:hypothetical protein